MAGNGVNNCCCFRAFLALGHLALVIAAIFIPWVKTDEAEWSLFHICFHNASTPNHKNYSLSSDLCGSLYSGDVDIPGYYEAMQAFTVILCFLCFLQLNVCCDNHGLDHGKRPVFMAFLCIVVDAVLLGIVFNAVPKDEGDYFQGEHLALSLSVYFILVSLILSIFLLIGNYLYDKHRAQQAAIKEKEEKVLLSTQITASENRNIRELPADSYVKSKPSVSLRPKNAVAPSPFDSEEGLSLGDHRHEFEQHRSESPASPDSDVSSDRSSDESSSVMDMSYADHSQMHNLDGVAQEELYLEDLRSASRASVLHNRETRREATEEAYGELPLLDNMPTYTLPPSRDSRTPRRPPPSYESAMREDYMDMPAPPVVTVPLTYFGDTQTELNPDV